MLQKKGQNMEDKMTEHKVTSRADGYGNRDCSCGGVWNDRDEVCSTLKPKQMTPTEKLLKLAESRDKSFKRLLELVEAECVRMQDNGDNGARYRIYLKEAKNARKYLGSGEVIRILVDALDCMAEAGWEFAEKTLQRAAEAGSK